MEREIDEATAALMSAVERGDAGAVRAVYAEQATLVAAAAGIVRGWHDIETYWRAGLGLGLSAVTFERRLLEPIGAAILSGGCYAFSVGGPRRRRVAERGSHLALHTRDAGGAWRRAVDVFTPDESTSARHDVEKE